jgi:MFS family permease
MPAGSDYLKALAVPGVLRFSSAGLLGRMQISMYRLDTVLLVPARTGKYGLAGLVAAAGAAGYALISPLTARLADRFRQRAALPPLAVLFAVASAALIAGAQAHAQAGRLWPPVVPPAPPPCNWVRWYGPGGAAAGLSSWSGGLGGLAGAWCRSGYPGIDDLLAAGDRADRVDELVRWAVFEQETACPGAQRGVEVGL